jgi:flagellar biosynthesis/type III secretory pathway protein FliH
MTSSYRATSHASVRQTPAAVISTAAAWAPDELSFSHQAAEPAVIAAPEIDPAVVAAERAALIDEGYARGLADGERKVTMALQTRTDAALATLRETIDKLSEAATRAPAILEENIAALAVVVARQIVQREVNIDRAIVADLVRRALTEFPIDQTIRIRVNPLDLAELTIHGDAAITGKHDVSWMADQRVARGGCLLEGRDRIIDGRVDTALERAYRRMAKHDA